MSNSILDIFIGGLSTLKIQKLILLKVHVHIIIVPKIIIEIPHIEK